MIGANWLLYSALVGGLMTLAAWQGGRALRATGWPSRWGWVLAGLMTVGFPMFAIITSPGESARILPVVSEPDGSVGRHGEGGREPLWWSEEAYRKRFPWMYRRDQAQADSTGRVPSSRRGVFVLSNGEVYKRFPDLGERRVNSYGLIPAAFGVDTVMVVWAVLQD